MDLLNWIWVPVGYICGSIPFALLLGLMRGVDVRTTGSGNVGATNLSRALGRKWGVGCFVLDLLKGLGPVLAAGMTCGHIAGFAGGGGLGGAAASQAAVWLWVAVAFAAVSGHMFPVWLGFRGGKGVATGLGVTLGFWPWLTLAAVVAAVVWLIFVKVYGYISLASMAGAVALALMMAVAATVAGEQMAEVRWPFLIVSIMLAVLVVYRHRANIVRLRLGTEPTIGQGRP